MHSTWNALKLMQPVDVLTKNVGVISITAVHKRYNHNANEVSSSSSCQKVLLEMACLHILLPT